MPALWSPEDLAVRFAPYIEELRDIFVMHRLEFGSPKHVGQLAAQLERSSQLHEELAALVRSIVLREGGSIPRTDLLEIVAIAIAGPRMEAAAEELQQPVRQLLSFLHTALRRPWNEPAGGEQHQSEENMHGSASDEEKPSAARESDSHDSPHRAVKTNVIPFGRARAVFSRLARADSEERIDEQASVHDVAEELPMGPPTFSGGNGGVAVLAEGNDGPDAQVCQDPMAPQQEAVSPPADTSPVIAQAELAGASKTDPAQIEQPQPAAEREVALADRSEPTGLNPMQTTSATPIAAPPHPVALPEFDDEPPLPAVPHIHRVALLSGIAASLLVAMGVTAVLHGGRAAHSIARAPAETAIASSGIPNNASPSSLKPSAIAAPQSADAHHKTGPSSAEASSAAGGPLSTRVSHAADDDYIAPPYSTPSPQTVPPEEPRPASSAVYTPAAAVIDNSRPSLRETSGFEPQESHLRDPDGAIVGDRSVPADSGVLSRPPLHPSVPPTVMAENLVSAPRPDYPRLAKLAHLDGPVVLHAEITPGGRVADTRVISGHLLLRRAAEAAVRHWRYRPYQVDGKPVPVSTTITVKFKPSP